MSTSVNVRLCYGVALDREALEPVIQQNGGYAYDFFEEKLEGYDRLEVVEAQGMYDADSEYVAVVKSSVIKSDEDKAVADADILEPSVEDVELLKQFVRELLPDMVNEPRWKMTVTVSN